MYYDWIELEQYLNQVLQRLLPDSLRSRSEIHVFPTTNPSPNAYATHDGSLFFQIGLLATLNNEAELAYTLAHELAHYLHRDALEFYFQRAVSETKVYRMLGFTQRSILMKSLKFSRTQEMAADSLGFCLGSKAGYDPYANLRLSDLLLRLDKREFEGDLDAYASMGSELSTHPQAGERKQMIEKYVRQLNQRGQLFLVNEPLFHTLRQQAGYEKLNQLAANQNLFPLLEEAFKYYLLHPKQSRVIALNLETLRKILYAYPDHKDQGFLTTHFQAKVFAKNEGVLRNLAYLFVDDSLSLQQSQNADVFRNGQPLFDTYAQAFEFFAKKALALHLTEPLLTMALYHHQDKTYRDKYLKEYLQVPGIRHREYAEALQHDQLFDLPSDQDMVLLDNPSYVEENFYGYRNRLLYAEEKKPMLLSALRQAVEKSGMNKKVSFLYEEFQENLQQTTQVYRMMNFLNILDARNIDHIVLPIFEPEYWETLKEYRIRHIEVVAIASLDEKTRKYRPLWLIPPLTPIGLIKQSCSLVNPKVRRHDFSIKYWSLNLSDCVRNAQTDRRYWYRKATDKRIAKRFVQILVHNDKVRESRSRRLKTNPIED